MTYREYIAAFEADASRFWPALTAAARNSVRGSGYEAPVVLPVGRACAESSSASSRVRAALRKL